MKLRDLLCTASLGAALLVSVMAVGGALRWTQAVVALLAAGAVAWQIVSRRRLDWISPLVAWLLAATVLTALQLVPLPGAVLEALQPIGNSLRDQGAAIAGTSPWQCLSLDPSATLRSLVMFLTLIAVALVGLRLGVVERGRFMILGGVACVCGLAAIAAGVHALLGADALYGLYEPLHMRSVYGPLLNGNHMGALMAIGSVLAIGLAFYERQSTQLRVLWIGICCACIAAGAGTLSRGALLGTGIGMFVTVAVLIRARMDRRERRHRRWRRDIPIAMVVGFGVALALYASAGNVTHQVENTQITELSKPISKFAAWKSSLTLVHESPWVGVGRGAVESSLTRVHPGSAYSTFSHLENEYLTTVVEWGIPGALLCGALLAWCVVVASRRWNGGPLAAAALGALSAIAFQSFVDFGIELLGLAVPVVLIASTVELVPLRPDRTPVWTRLLRILLVLVLIASAGALTLPVARSVQEDQDDLLAEPNARLADVTASIERHPLDYFSFGMAADVSSRGSDVGAIAYLNQALTLHPTHPGLHRLAARMLVGLGRYSQAAVEYSLAMEPEGAPRSLLDEIVTLIPDPEIGAAAIPLDYPNPEIVEHALVEMKRTDIEQRWLARVAELPQHDLRVIDRLYELAQTRADFAAAERAAQLRLSVAHTTASRLKLATAQFERGEYPDLLAELANVRTWNGPSDERGAAWLILCDVYIEQQSWDSASECVHHLDASGLVSHATLDARTKKITEARTHESKMKAIEALERAVGSSAN